jgi:single-strand DNA-binding protein
MSTARSLNKVILIGNLTRPAVLKKTANQSVVGTFGIATNATWKDSEGNIQERAEFHNIVAWNKLAEICAQILNIGMLVYLEGELRTRTWSDESGRKHYRTDIKINDMKLLDAKDKQGVGIEEAYKLGESDKEFEDIVTIEEEVITAEPISSKADELF